MGFCSCVYRKDNMSASHRSIKMGRLSGKTALITGCNRGIGKGILQAFIQEGAIVIACTRNVTKELKEEYGKLQGTIIPIQIDLSDEESIKLGMKSILDMKMPIDILVNNAGIAKFKPFVMSKVDDFKQMMQVNLYGPILITQYVIKNMLKQKKGSIINLSSVSALDSNAGNAAYGASKAALASLTKTMSKELAKANIRVNAIAPGFVDTDMNSQISTQYLQKMMEQISVGRLADVAEIAKLAVFLGSDDASYITGQIIRVDGGM